MCFASVHVFLCKRWLSSVSARSVFLKSAEKLWGFSAMTWVWAGRWKVSKAWRSSLVSLWSLMKGVRTKAEESSSMFSCKIRTCVSPDCIDEEVVGTRRAWSVLLLWRVPLSHFFTREMPVMESGLLPAGFLAVQNRERASIKGCNVRNQTSLWRMVSGLDEHPALCATKHQSAGGTRPARGTIRVSSLMSLPQRWIISSTPRRFNWIVNLWWSLIMWPVTEPLMRSYFSPMTSPPITSGKACHCLSSLLSKI